MSASRKKTILIVAIVLCIAGLWLLLWHRIGDSVSEAEVSAAYAQFTFADAYYEECDLRVVQLYDSAVTAIDNACCGSKAGEVSFPDGTFSVYHLASLEQADKQDGILLMDYNGKLRSYELSGFTALDGTPSITEVCAAYGIASAENICAVHLSDTEGNPLQTLSDEAEIQQFYDKMIALGEALRPAEQAKMYYDVYAELYGENGFTDDLALEGESLTPCSDEAAERAYTLWGDGMSVVTIELDNGLWMTDLVYAPVPQIFTIVGSYRLTEAFF